MKDIVNQSFEEGETYSDIFVLYGSINQEIVNASLRIIENKLENLKFSKSVISRAKLIGVEVMENIYKHQSRTSTISPYFQIALNGSGLSMCSGNSISANNYDVLSERLSSYDTMSLDELKELYLNKLSNDEVSESGNVGLGLITILNRSNKKTAHKLSKVSDTEYFFQLEVNVLGSAVVAG